MRSPDRLLSTGHPGADAVERAVALLCLAVFAGLCLGMATLGTPVDWRDVVRIMACVALLAAISGIWRTNLIEDVPARSFGDTWARWLAQLQDRLMPGAGVLAGLERSGGRRHALVLAVEAMAGSDTDLSRAIDRSRTGMAHATGVLDDVVDRTLAAACTIRATTADVSALRQTASDLAEAAQSSRHYLQALSSKTAPLANLADQMHRELQAMARQAASLPPCAPDAAPAAEAIRTMATSLMVVLDTMLATLADLTGAIEGSVTQVEQMTALVLDQSRECDALTRSILAEGNEVAALLRQIEVIRPALMVAQASGEEIRAIEAARRRAARTVWQDAATVRGRAETIALLLKGLPDFSGPNWDSEAPETLGVRPRSYPG